MSTEKVQAVKDWPTLKTVKNMQEFLAFANFYRRFIENFAKIAQPLIELTKGKTPWVWNRWRQEAFDELKKRFCEAPVLAHFHSEKKTILETDASDYAYGSVLSQMQEVNSCPKAGVKTQEDNSRPGAGVKKTRAHPVAYSWAFNVSQI